MTEGPLEQTFVYGKVRGLLDEWFKYAEDLDRERVSLNYTSDKLSTTRKLLHEILDPKLATLPQVRQQFKAPDRCVTWRPTSRYCPDGSDSRMVRSGSRT